MSAKVEEHELLVVGGGPAGLSAAIAARQAGVEVVVVDERVRLGGQIHKQLPDEFRVSAGARLDKDVRAGQALIENAIRSGIDVRTQTVAWGIWGQQVGLVRDERDAYVVNARCVLLAPGAYDRPQPFPGWTLPGVMTAGAAQVMVKTQRVLPGHRILLAGSGPLILAFAAELATHGGHLMAVLEAAPRPGIAAIARLLANARGNTALLAAAVKYFIQLTRRGVSVRYGRAIVRADGDGAVQTATIARIDRDGHQVRDTEEVIEVDAVCLGYGFCPSTELARLAGCATRHDQITDSRVPIYDEWMRTSVPGILVAGDGSEIAGARVATEEGRLAGIAAAREVGRLNAEQADRLAAPIRAQLRRMRAFSAVLNDLYRPRPGLDDIATADTVICRCEEVTRGDLEARASGVTNANVAKTLTRAGMGRCQGRNCARSIAAVLARRAALPIGEVEPLTIRPPVKPIPVAAIAAERPERPRPVVIR